MSSGSHGIDISAFKDGERHSCIDNVAIEEPLEIRLGFSTPNGRATRSISITMRTPGNDKELAIGFLYTESIIHRAQDITSIETCGSPATVSGDHNVIRVGLKSDVQVDIDRLQRHFFTSSSCGVCGKTSIDALRISGLTQLNATTPVVSAATLIDLPDKLRALQPTFDQTGGLHAAGAFDTSGKLITIMEDIGRHNAVDKMIGSLLLAGRLPASRVGLIVSGRASFELVQKALAAGIPLLAAVGAPSSLAVELAADFGMTLIGFLRGDTFNIYSAAERVCP